jgi:hypothetical protein
MLEVRTEKRDKIRREETDNAGFTARLQRPVPFYLALAYLS